MSTKRDIKRIEKALRTLRGAVDPLERVDAVRHARDAADALERTLVDEARAAGATWAQIGALYGMTKQGAQQRFAPSPAPAARRKRKAPPPA